MKQWQARGVGRVRLRLEGLSLEKLITRAAAQGIRLKRIERHDLRTMTATLSSADLPRLQALASSVGWRVTVLHESMLRRSQRLLSRRVMLAAGFAVFLACVWAAMQCVWFVRIEGAAESVGEVRTVLADYNIVPGRWKGLLDLPAVQRALERRLPRIAWVDVHYDGASVVVDCVPARIASPAAYGAQPCDVIATRDGVISSITVYAGIAKVKVGDTVRKGQVLVAGEERTADGEVKLVGARAAVESKVWYSGRARLPAWQSAGEPTGRDYQRTLLGTLWGTWPEEEMLPYEHRDVDIRRQVIGGMFVPVWLQQETYTEVKLSAVPRDRTELERESAAAAERIAREKVPFQVQIIDKWVEYSMMKDDHFCAEVTLEAVEEIAELSAPT